MKERYSDFLKRTILVPFLRNEKLKTFESVSEEGARKLQDMVEDFTAAKTHAKRQKILSEYAASINAENTGSAFYKAMFGMMLNLRREVYNSADL